MKRILVIGGALPATGAQIVSPPADLHLVLQLEEFESLYPEIAAKARADGFGLKSLSSWHMGPKIWKRVAARIH
jgi:hypothetical protein